MKPDKTNIPDNTRPDAIAIVGMGCLFPKAPSLADYWQNIRDGVDCITSIPATHWRPEEYFDADPKSPDHTYAKRGGFLSPYHFNPMEWGIAPNSIEATDTSQLLGMVAAHMALTDAGYGPGRDFDRSRVNCIMGITGALELVIPLGARLGHPIWKKALRDAGVDETVAKDVVDRISSSYVGWQEASFPGLLGNVVAGRIANRLDLGGTNCVVDAACASSLSAIHMAMLELQTGRCDMAITGGADTFNDIFMFMCFSKTPALSPTGNARPLSQDADGTILGEGIGTVILKRYADARRDGDRVYAVITGMGTSSDGKGQAIYAPSSAGQTFALNRAYAEAAVTPRDIQMVEAHGTGTKVGDAVEIKALTDVYRAAGTDRWCTVGSVKSQIGHAKAAAGIAGVIKTAMSLYQKTLPPTIKISQPVKDLEASPFLLSTKARPWIVDESTRRRAAVSAFGFGGSNYHCVLEEADHPKTYSIGGGRTQIFSYSAHDRNGLTTALQNDLKSLTGDWQQLRLVAKKRRAAFNRKDAHRLSFVVTRDQELTATLLIEKCLQNLVTNAARENWQTPDGIIYDSRIDVVKVAGLFPGQGAQYPGMLQDLACDAPEFQESLTVANRINKSTASGDLSDVVFPPTAFTDVERQKHIDLLTATQHAQPAIGAVSVGALKIMTRFGLGLDVSLGHSFGELPALFAAGVISEEDLHVLAAARGRCMGELTGDRGSMLAVQAERSIVNELVKTVGDGIVIANENTPKQWVLSGTTEAINRATAVCQNQKIAFKSLNVAAAFHSTLVADASSEFAKELGKVDWHPAKCQVLANVTADIYPADVKSGKKLLAKQIGSPVKFMDAVQKAYELGARVYVEIGPDRRLAGLTSQILDQKNDVTIISLDQSRGKKSGAIDLAACLAQLATRGVSVDLNLWDQAFDESSVVAIPKFAVPICGANYVAPVKTPLKPVVAPRPAVVQLPSTPIAAKPVVDRVEVRAPEVKPVPVKPSETRIANIPSNSIRTSTMTRTPLDPVQQHAAAHDPGDFTRQMLLAMQKMQQQNAELYHQFLANQKASQEMFFELASRELGMNTQRALPVSANRPQVQPAEPLGRHPVAESAPVVTRTPVQQFAASSPAPAIKTAPVITPTPAPVAKPVVQPKAVVKNGAAGHAAPSVNVSELLLDVVADRTGYPKEMLELNMRLEGDLGIDSIKRVEILSLLQSKLPGLDPAKATELANLQTLADIVAALKGHDGSAAEPERQGAVTVPANDVAGAAAGDELISAVIAVVSEKTGYPTEMLDPGMHLESDLGIDSIKRVEIFSALQEQIQAGKNLSAEDLASIRTIQDIVDRMAVGMTGNKAASKGVQLPFNDAVDTKAPGVDRLILNWSNIKESNVPAITPAKAGVVWIAAESGNKIAKALAAQYLAAGFSAEIHNCAGILKTELPEVLQGLIVLVDQSGKDVLALTLEAFTAVQHCGPGLRKNGASHGAFFCTVTTVDGQFGLSAVATDEQAASLAVAGISKTAHHEWTEVACTAIDCDPGVSVKKLVSALVETSLETGPYEIGITNGGRKTLELVQVDLPARATAVRLNAGDLVVVTGGARGVTGVVAQKLAEAYKPTMLILGRSELPAGEPGWLAGATDETAIKRAIFTNSPTKLTPDKVQSECAKILAAREMTSRLADLAKSGASVIYRAVDVRDAKAVATIVEEIQKIHGPVRGIMHGAGVLADRLILDKTAEQFSMVLDTKCSGLNTLLAACKTGELKTLVLFSSSTGRFGRKGQVDYAVANEYLNKMGQRIRTTNPNIRVVSVNWGPWDGGMVTPALKKLFHSEGIATIGLEAGADYLLDELEASGNEPVEIVVLGSSETVIGKKAAPDTFSVSVKIYPVLADHVMNGRGVVPAALMMEWIAAAGMKKYPGLMCTGCESFRVYKGITVAEDESLELQIVSGNQVRRGSLLISTVELRTLGKDGALDILNARADVLLAEQLDATHDSKLLAVFTEDEPISANIYGQTLFHGPILQGIKEIQGCSDSGITALIRSDVTPESFGGHRKGAQWVTQPFVVDCCFQIMIVWSTSQHGAPCLPSSWNRYRQYVNQFPTDGCQIRATVTEFSGSQIMADIEILDNAGKVLAEIEGYQATMAASLRSAFVKNTMNSATLH